MVGSRSFSFRWVLGLKQYRHSAWLREARLRIHGSNHTWILDFSVIRVNTFPLIFRPVFLALSVPCQWEHHDPYETKGRILIFLLPCPPDFLWFSPFLLIASQSIEWRGQKPLTHPWFLSCSHIPAATLSVLLSKHREDPSSPAHVLLLFALSQKPGKSLKNLS